MSNPRSITNRHGQTVATVHPPTGPAVPVVVSVPHAGESIPDDIDALLDHSDHDLRHEMLQDVDRFVDRFWPDAPSQGAWLIVAHHSRYVVDLNRAPDDTSAEVVQGAVAKDQPGYYGERGVIWARTTRRTPVWQAPMSQEAFERRIGDYHVPYHQALEALLTETCARFGRVLLIDGHSMPSQGRAGHGDTGQRRPDINPGTVDDTSTDHRFADIVDGHLREQGLEVKRNAPYKGGWITRHYGRPQHGWHAIQIEVNRHLYMDEVTCAPKEEGIARVRAAMAGIIPAITAAMGTEAP